MNKQVGYIAVPEDTQLVGRSLAYEVCENVEAALEDANDEADDETIIVYELRPIKSYRKRTNWNEVKEENETVG